MLRVRGFGKLLWEVSFGCETSIAELFARYEPRRDVFLNFCKRGFEQVVMGADGFFSWLNRAIPVLLDPFN
jgi:hypothetical protein